MKTSTRTPQRLTMAESVSGQISWQYLFVVIAFGMVLAAGFFFAARQHFNSMEFGINNSKLRQELEDLKTENRRLTLAKEVALSPRSVKKAAHEAGLMESGVDAEVMQASIRTADVAGKPATTKSKNSTDEIVSVAKVQKTAFQRAVLTAAAYMSKRSSAPEREKIVTVAQLR